ncbi:MAG: pilin [Patescibacteria group bacterium]
MRKILTIFIAFLIIAPMFSLGIIKEAKALTAGTDCGYCISADPASGLTDGRRCNVNSDCAPQNCTYPTAVNRTDDCGSGSSCITSSLICSGTSGGGTTSGRLDPWGAGSGGTVTEDSLKTSAGLNDKDPREIAANVINVILGFLGIIAVVLILIGGFMWMTAAGNEDKTGTAKKIMTAGVIGLVIILAAFGIARFVIQALLTATMT